MFEFYLPVLAEASGWEQIVFPLIFLFFAVILLFIGYRAFFKKRLIENVPTSKCQGVTIGLNELKGTSEARPPLKSYLSERDVVYYSYKIEEQYKKTVRKDGKKRTKKKWRTIASETRYKPFMLHDDTGNIRVNPRGAEFHGDKVVSKTCRRSDPMYYGKGPRRRVRRSTGKRRFREDIIAHGEKTYVMGSAQIRDDIAKPEIGDDEFADLFLISSQSEDKLISKFAWQARGCFFGAILFAAAVPLIYTMQSQGLDIGPAFEASVIWMVLVGMMVFSLVFFLYLKTVFNGLVDLRNRVARAWSMLEVEFKRRHDLIPNLAQMVQGFADHEKETMEAVTEARSAAGGGADEVSSAIDEQTSALGNIFAIAEDYPEIKADAGFRKLMEELTRCEDKIALARSFYNDSVERVNNRVHTFPDMLLAPLAGTEEESLLAFDEFEKKPVEIDLQPDVSEEDEEFVESEQVDDDEMVDDDEAVAEGV